MASTSTGSHRACQQAHSHHLEREGMREIFKTAIVITLVALAVVLLLLAARGFRTGPSDPIVSSGHSRLPLADIGLGLPAASDRAA